jgi:indolepyruvate ferredoxin oxidoreductase
VPPSDAPATFSIEDRFTTVDGEVPLTGTQALVRILIDQRRADQRAGLSTAGFVSGYPGSPVGGVDLELMRRGALLREHDIVFRPGLNEELAATAVWGAQTVNSFSGAKFAGVFGMWFGKAPGVDRAADAFRHNNIRGTSATGGVLAVAGDDPAPRSTVFPSDSTHAFYDWSMPVLFPGNIQDVVDLGLHGYALSRASGLWIGFKFVTEVADGTGVASVGPDRIVPFVPAIEFDGQPFAPALRVNTPGARMREAERDLAYARLAMAAAYIRANNLNPVTGSGPARIGLVAAGKVYFDLQNALGRLGLAHSDLVRYGIRVKKVSALFPVETAEWREFADGLSEIIVLEEKRPFLERFLKDALYGQPGAPAIVGKTDERGERFLPINGEYSGDLVARLVGTRLASRWGIAEIASALPALERPERVLLPLAPARNPYFCSGCPHNRSLEVPAGSVVGAGIGCHIMAMALPREEYGELAGFTQMGGEGAQWVGMAPFTKTPHIFQNLGDGTFAHSGSLAIRFAIASGADITYKILYNRAVGMTGGQDVTGGLSVPALISVLEAEGVRRVIVTTDDPGKYRGIRLPGIATVRHRDDLVRAQEELAQQRGVTVLLHDQECAAEKRRLRKRDRQAEPTRRIVINERVCEGCGDCNAKSNCLSVRPVETEFGRKTRIDQSSCNFDYSCVRGDCPSFVSVDVAGASPLSRPEPALPAGTPDPVIVRPQAFNVFMVGIGGTGVVTVSQILAAAAVVDGLQVRNLDLTGSSQKAGPVVSQLQLYSDDREPATTIGQGQADLFLAFDLLTSVSPLNLAKADPDRTIVAGSTSRVPTGRMAFQPDLPYPDTAVLEKGLREASRGDDSVFIDAQEIALAGLGSAMYANMVLLGAAYQIGAVPVSLSSLRAAISANGVAIESNLAAFTWGRIAVAAPAQLPALLGYADAGPAAQLSAALRDRVAGIEGDDELMAVLGIRVPDLVGYQDERHAMRYVAAVADSVSAERTAGAGPGTVSVPFARGLYKLLAYKDEYEVARLQLEAAQDESIRRQFGTGVKVSWLLHPPVLRALGLQRKVRLGRWFRPVFRLLVAMRRLRGTALDPFGYARVRRVERALIAHYQALMAQALGRLAAGKAPAEAVAALAAAPDLIRGYEHIKLDNARAYLAEVIRQRTALGLEETAGERQLSALIDAGRK